MADFCVCTACAADLRGPAISADNLHYYGGEAVCRHGCGQPSHYSRLIGVYDWEEDRTVAWRCPDCGHEEDRA